ncbi:MAG: hypothetical protein IJX59_07680 [Clostridia bacterium]|nr:hypothetical protein [Clostridia bacterium]
MKQTKKMTLQEKMAAKKEREQRYNRIAIIIAIAILVFSLLAVAFSVLRSFDFKKGTPYDKEELYGTYWYTEDGTTCWYFSKVEGGDYVYFFTREGEDDPYITKVYTAFTAEEEKGKMDVYLEKNAATTFTCTFKGDKLTLHSSNQTMKFEKGVSVAEKNKLILGVVGSPYQKEALLGCWYSEDDKKCWQIKSDGSLEILTRADVNSPFATEEQASYTAEGEKGNLIVEREKGAKTVYACTIREGKLILVANNARTVLTKGADLT